MATKKAASATKKSANKKPTTKKQTTTKVTTVKAVESRPAAQAATASSKRSVRFGLSRTPLVAALVAEFIGAFILAAVFLAGSGNPLLMLFAVAGVALAVGMVSGGYANPAVVVGAWVTRRMTLARAVGYIVAEVLGAMLALVILNMYVSSAPAETSNMLSSGSAGVQLFSAATISDGKQWFVFLSEFIGTMIYGFAFASALREKRNNRTTYALTIGIGAFLGLMVATYAATSILGFTTALNPAVAVALQAFNSNFWVALLVYGVGSVLGGVIGFVVYDLLRGPQEKEA